MGVCLVCLQTVQSEIQGQSELDSGLSLLLLSLFNITRGRHENVVCFQMPTWFRRISDGLQSVTGRRTANIYGPVRWLECHVARTEVSVQYDSDCVLLFTVYCSTRLTRQWYSL